MTWARDDVGLYHAETISRVSTPRAESEDFSALGGDRRRVRHVGNAVLLVPTGDPWSGFATALGQFTDDFMLERVQPTLEARESL